MIIAVQQYREAMALFDLKLREMKGILGSYNNIKLSAQEYSGEDFEEDFDEVDGYASDSANPSEAFA